MNLFEKLQKIQCELKAPKNQRNNFGGYNYRSCEDILEALKPLLEATKTALTIEDEVVLIGERYYIKAKATLYDCESEAKLHTTAFAREPLTKKGSDEAQISGGSSSYARKYCLNGLFCIDDTKDSDYTNTHGKGAVSAKEVKEIEKLITETNSDLKQFLLHFGLNELKDMNEDIYVRAKQILLQKKQGDKK